MRLPLVRTLKPFFASHDAWGIVDAEATKTVMGSNYAQSFLSHLDPSIRKQVKRSSCEVLFRFSNQGTLKASQALIVPVCGLWLKIAIVSGATPVLISNTLLRAIGAIIDTRNHQLILPKQQVPLPLELTNKELYLLDMNQLFKIAHGPGSSEHAAETYAQDMIHGAQKDACEPPKSDHEVRSKGVQVTGQRSAVQLKSDFVQTPMNLSSQFSTSDPVNDRKSTAQSENSQFCSQDLCDLTSISPAFVHHEQLEPSPVQSASQLHAGIRSRADWSPDLDRAQGDPHELRQDSPGEVLCRNLESRPAVHLLVPGTLCQPRPSTERLSDSFS